MSDLLGPGLLVMGHLHNLLLAEIGNGRDDCLLVLDLMDEAAAVERLLYHQSVGDLMRSGVCWVRQLVRRCYSLRRIGTAIFEHLASLDLLLVLRELDMKRFVCFDAVKVSGAGLAGARSHGVLLSCRLIVLGQCLLVDALGEWNALSVG